MAEFRAPPEPGTTAAQARAAGWDVDPEVPDCAVLEYDPSAGHLSSAGMDGDKILLSWAPPLSWRWVNLDVKFEGR